MPTNPMVKFKRGLQANLPTAINDGTLYLTTDEGALYLDNNSTRIRLGDVVAVNSISDLPAGGPKYQATKGMIMYYAKAENVLARWDAAANNNTGAWVQINAAGLTKVKNGGSGGDGATVISGLSVVTDTETGAKVLQYTTSTVATAEGLEELHETVEDHATRLPAVEKKAADNTKAIEDLTKKHNDELAALETELRNGYTGDMAALNTAIGEVRTAAQNAQTKAEEGVTAAGNEKTRAENAEKALGERIDGVTTAINNEKTRAEGKEDELATAIGEVGEKADANAEDIEQLGIDLQAEITRATEADAAHVEAIGVNTQAIATEKGRAEGAEAALGERIDETNQGLSDLSGVVEGHGTRIKNTEDAIALLNDTDASKAGSIAYAIAQIVEKNENGSVDTLKEISAWIADHPNSVAEINAAIQANKDLIDDNAEAIEALQEEDTEINGRLQTLETAVGTNGSVDTRIESELAAVLGVGTDSFANTVGTDYDTIIDIVTKLKAAEVLAGENKTAVETAQGAADAASQAAAAEASRAKGEEARIEGLVTTEAGRADAAEKALGGRIDNAVTAHNELAETVNGHTTTLEGHASDIKDLQDDLAAEVLRADTEEKRIVGLVNTEKGRAEAAEGALQEAINEINTAISGDNGIDDKIDNIIEHLTWGSF